MSDRETLDVYARKAADYAELTEGAPDPHLDRFIAALPRGAQVLDLGCGPGMAAGRMAQAGLSATALDPVPEMVALAAARPGVTARQGTAEAVTEDDHYQGIWANFSLLHAPRSEMPSHLARLAKALRPGGLLHIGLKTGTGEKRDSLGRLYTYYEEDELTDLLTAAGFTPEYRATGRDRGLDGTLADWIVLQAVRHG
jgi:SAM-dependent methyltransferase